MKHRCPDCEHVATSRANLLKHEQNWLHGRAAPAAKDEFNPWFSEPPMNDSEWLHVQGSIAVSAHRLNSRSTSNARSDEPQPEEGS